MTTSAGQTLRVLVVSHGHPALSLGGAEVASYNLHQGLKSAAGSQSFFLARVGDTYPRHGRSALMGVSDADDELLYHADDYDHFLISNRNTGDIQRDLRRFARTLRPDVVHFHHFIGLGLEALYAVRDALPNAVIAVTFHEFLPICHHHGQMVKTGGNKLCEASSPIACNGCFPEISPGAFLRRKHFIQSILSLADGFIAPSRFLMDRYVAWGLPEEKCAVIENGLNVRERAPPRVLEDPTQRRSRFAYFGQMTPYKGIDVLLEAVQRIPKAVWGDDASLTIFGGNLERQPEPFRKKIGKLLKKTGDRVRFAGAYQNKDMPSLMRQVDWVLMPSVWWENSPVIIQEAFFHKRPLICSGIGGMAEKVRDGVDGLHFRAASPEDLADRMSEVLRTPKIWDQLHKGIVDPKTHFDSAQEHLTFYRTLKAGRSSSPNVFPGGLQKSA
ncbi:glycosyltransferase family 4 protein [Roseibium aggregatum]|uniref:Glycosyltransferase family 4 protein n=1 Tax=Roseibium aggregatum TaxID=187304 RepID=A0A939J1K8_9HYPH|nr:glycosyltransferase family 4 protein [Roseibium aggregatum]MBN9672251.1 glycosyltransferase family 4 protein [Roseibium aggregatum]